MTDTFANKLLAARLQPRTPGPGGAVNERELAMYEAGRQAGMGLAASIAASHRSALSRPLHEFDRGATAIARSIEHDIRARAAEIAKEPSSDK